MSEYEWRERAHELAEHLTWALAYIEDEMSGNEITLEVWKDKLDSAHAALARLKGGSR